MNTVTAIGSLTRSASLDLTDELPSGTTMLDASAGTGKTHAIASIVVREIAEGRHRIDQLMIVTFGRAATSELRGRIRARLQQAAAALDAAQSGIVASGDEVDRLLCAADRTELRRRSERVREALADVDVATIATTHEFCARMLDELGLLVDHDSGTRFVDGIEDLVGQVIRDRYLAVYGSADRPPALSELLAVGKAAVDNRTADLMPDTPGAAHRVAFARDVRDEVERRMRLLGVFTFDDMVSRLAAALTDPVSGPVAADLLAARFPLVCVDEFQDTDPLQWQIVESAFVGRSTVILIGDPKQAIYGFRGADIHAYLSAAASADRRLTLNRNHRSDAAVVAGISEILAGAGLGGASVDDEILVGPVDAAHTEPRLRWRERAGLEDQAPVGPVAIRSQAAVEIRCRPLDPNQLPRVDAMRSAVDADLVVTVTDLLRRAQISSHGPSSWRDLQPRDIAVLVRRNKRGEDVRMALMEAGVPTVFTGASSVFGSPAARDWAVLLAALVDPRQATITRASMGCLIGWTLPQLVAADDEQLTTLTESVKRLSTILPTHGVAAVFEALSQEFNLQSRLLATPTGERDLTDARHLAQALHRAALGGGLGPSALAEWLNDRIEEARRVTQDDSRRLETDRDAVQVMTIHRAKGLEFPVVLLPDAADCKLSDDPEPPVTYHLEHRRVLDVGGDRGWGQRVQRAVSENAAEQLRDQYVAMTRARSRLVMWWAPTVLNTAGSPLHRLLFRDRNGAPVPDGSYPVDRSPVTLPLDRSLVDVHEIGGPAPARLLAQPEPGVELAVRKFTRTIDHGWRRTSYSGLTVDAHDVPGGGADEPTVPDTASASDSAGGPPSPMADLPGGTSFGSLVHTILEHVETSTGDLPGEIARRVSLWTPRVPIAGLDSEMLVRALVSVMQTSLGTIADGRRLADIAPADRLAELSFDLPMGGVAGVAPATVADLAALWRDPELIQAEDPLARYGDVLATSPAAPRALRGFLTGSIDAVLRLTGPMCADSSGSSRYLVIDYKTNRLPTRPGEVLSCLHYAPEPMARAMMAAHYPLQALLYCVALHRYLRWRQPGYDPAVHLGGVGYLFVRGMAGADTPVVNGMPCGVFSWHPRPELVLAASEVLAGSSIRLASAGGGA